MIIKYTKCRIILSWLLFVLAFGLIFKGIFITSPLQSDDTTYFAYASGLSMDLFKNAHSQSPFRIGILAPLAGLQKLFGYTLTAYYLYSLGSALLLLAMVYLLGFKTGGLRSALFSSLLFACSFFGLYRATNVYPDVPNLALLIASFLVFMYVAGKKGRDRILILFLSALLAFCSYLVKAPNLVFLLAIPVYELLTKKSLKTTCLFSFFFIILWLGECFFYLIIADDFLLRVKMIFKGVNKWVKYMPEISWQIYLQEPFTRLTRTFAGILIVWGGLAGTITAIWKRNHVMIASLAGALSLYIIYSYSVTSFAPLRRALPINIRYIVAFTAMLTIATGYALSNLKPIIGKIFSTNIATLVLAFIFIILIGFQVKELPQKLPNTIFFKDNSYFVADQLFKDINKISDLKGKVYAYPAKDFRMYPNFSKLGLKGFSPAYIKGGRYYLYSRERVRRTLLYGFLGKNEKVVRNQKLLLLRTNPKWDYLINTEDIVLAYVPSLVQKQTEAITLAGTYFFEYWGKPKTVIAQKAGDSTKFHFDQRKEPIYLFTFPGKFSLPPNEHVDIFNKLKPNQIYELKIQYRILKKIQELGISFSQYDDTKRIDSISFTAPSTPGTHMLTKLLATTSSYIKFRLIFGINNEEKENQLEIEKISFSLLSE